MNCKHIWKVAQSNVIRDTRDGQDHGYNHRYIVWGSVYCTRCGASGNFDGVGVASNV